MSDATTQTATIDPAQAAHFGKLAADWWNPKGSSAMLHKLNPVRLRFVRDMIDRHWGTERQRLKPLTGLRALDVGCGAGLLTEPLSRLGALTAGLDAAPENIVAARLHAEGQGLSIDYRVGSVDTLAGETFDLVCAMEVIEHVADPTAFARGLSHALAPGGLLLMSTPNRTLLSRIAMIMVGEGAGFIPKGTHDWTKFLQPEQLRALLDGAGLEVIETRGLSFNPMNGFVLSMDTKMDYLIAAVAR